jgi:methylmalonyl-CoA carboxyltransferase small subunit
LKLKITVDGKSYEVDVEAFEPELPQPGYVPHAGQARVPAAAPGAAPPVPSVGATPVADESKVCRSPFAGVVSRVSVQVGQSIQVNDVLMVLEAMKMETVITAPRAGQVGRILVDVGDAVQQGQVLVEFRTKEGT